ncbi:MAG: proteasome subunit beta [Candidatus Korarchaeota archaeon]|nr:proteasome subunit beta [Thermoproteota archaeon]
MAFDNEMKNKLIHGTTTVGLVFKEGVILGADRRASAGYLIASKRAVKIHKITNYIAMTISGTVADAQVLVRWLQTRAQTFKLNVERDPTVLELVNLLSNVMHSYFKRLIPFVNHFIVAGVDVTGPHIVFLDHAGSMQEEKFIATGSGSPIALGVLEDGFRDDLTRDDAIKLVLTALRSAILRDVFSGDGVDLVIISREEGFQRLSPDEINKHIKLSYIETYT